jgi:hypothetical protein
MMEEESIVNVSHSIRVFTIAVVVLSFSSTARPEFTLIRDGKPLCVIVIDTQGTQGSGADILRDAGKWLADCLQSATGASLPVVEAASKSPALIIARADAYPAIADKAGLKSGVYDAFCIVTQPSQLYVLGNSEDAARNGVSLLLREWGFRWYAPSPRWHVVPALRNVSSDLNIVDTPKLIHRGIWYAYGAGEKELGENYQRWAIANRLSVRSVIRTGHSYGNIVRRNQDEFDRHPEYYALLPDGKRDSERAIDARKLCFSNKDLIKLVTVDRLRLLDEYHKANPAAYMVSVDPSDGEGTCHCGDCQKLGTTTDRVLHLANEVARGLREMHENAWVGLYAYSSHRLPPKIEVEPNVYVQVAMGFNRTQYTLPELVELWSKKVGAIGLREYYGVEAWDWGLPGRMRGGRVAYHAKWIPYYAERKLNAINAETNANWGGQMLGLYVASQLMWSPAADVELLVNEFFEQCYATATEPMRRLQTKFDDSPPLRAATLLPMYRDLADAWSESTDAQVRARLVDMMAYMIYVEKFREFDLARNRRPSRDGEYYDALLPLMQYAWRIRLRDIVHYYALARRLCNGLPVQDKRLDFYMFNKEQPPVWMSGEPVTDEEIVALFHSYLQRLESDGDPVVTYSRYLEPVRVPGEDAGPSRLLSLPDEDETAASFRNGLTGYVVPSGERTVRFSIAPTSREAAFTVYLRGDTVLFQQAFRQSEEFQSIEIELPKANEYRVVITGSFRLRVPSETPFVFEASAANPAWIDYSGPHYFYVPKGARQLIVDASPRLSLFVPGKQGRLDISPANREGKKDFVVIDVAPEAAGKLWHTSSQTRGKISLMNVPPLMSFHRNTVFVPREVAEADSLTTKGR